MKTTFAIALWLGWTGMAGLATAMPEPAPREPVMEWDSGSLTLIERNAGYGRMACLADGAELCAFSRGGDLCVRRIDAGGGEWGPTQIVAGWADGMLTNAELLPLRNGDVLLFGNARPAEAMRHERRRMSPRSDMPGFDIRLYRSSDGGRSWSGPVILFTAGPDRNTGCWEPAGVELPCGEILVMFANESPYPKTGEQEISLLRSFDSGRSWSPPETLAFRKGHRDGMPVPLILEGGGGMVVAIEDNGWVGPLKPSILFTSLDDAWRSGPVTGDSLRRWYALAEPPRSDLYGGAPYIRQMPSGETLLAFQERVGGPWEEARMAVCVGDDRARNFRRIEYPFPAPKEGGQLWNSLYVRDAETVVALTTASFGGVKGLWRIDGLFVRPKAGSQKTVESDADESTLPPRL